MYCTLPCTGNCSTQLVGFFQLKVPLHVAITLYLYDTYTVKQRSTDRSPDHAWTESVLKL